MANEELKRENLERALEAAYQCFLEVGIDKTTQAMVAKRSGVSMRSVCRYFTDKTDMAIQVAEYVGAKVERDVAAQVAGLRDLNKTGVELLYEYMERVERRALEKPEAYALRQEYLLFTLRNHLPYEMLNRRLTNIFGNHAILREIFRIGRADGTIKTALCDEAEMSYFQQAFMTAVSDQAIRYWAGSAQEERKAFLDEYIKRVVNGYPQERHEDRMMGDATSVCL